MLQKFYYYLVKATGHSFAGFKKTWSDEYSFRVEIILGIILFPLAFFVGETTVERILLIGSLFLVLITELLNSAIENTVNLACEDYNLKAKAAKDQGSAAVFVTLVNVILVWGLIFFD